jgi:hypothetical protein
MKQTLALAFGAAIIVGTMIGAPDLSAAEKVSVCHRTGNGGSHVIEIAQSAVKAHLAHGDHLEVAAGLKSGTPCQPAVGAVQPPAPVVQPPVQPPAPVVQPPVQPPPILK